MSAATAAPLGDYRRPSWRQALLDCLPEGWSWPGATRWMERLPLVGVLLLLVVMTLRLHNGAFTDEALSINAGHEYIAHWLTGSAASHYGTSLSGFPMGYSVLAAALDSVGGLFLVRAFSLICVSAATVFLFKAVSTAFSRRAGFMAAAMFAVCAPVAFVAASATSDALALALLAAAFWLGVTGAGIGTALAAGAVLGLTPLVHYTAATFLPVLLVAMAAVSGRHRARRTAAATAVLAVVLGALTGTGIVPIGVLAESWTGQAIGPFPRSGLVGWLVLDIGVLLLVAVAGAFTMSRRGVRATVLAGVLLAGAAVLPLAQVQRGELVAFDRNLAYSALFLAPLAGFALAALSRRTWKLGPVVLVLLGALLFAAARSWAMDSTWPNVGPVVAAMERNPAPGLNLASGSAMQPLKYYTRQIAAVRWQNTYDLYAQGNDAVRVAVEDLRFTTIVVDTAHTGSPDEDARQAALLSALHDNFTDYRLIASFPVRGPSSPERWLVYRRVAGAP